MWIIIALAAVVLVLCREMTVESMISKHEMSQAKADAAELGVEQFVLSALAGDVENPGYLGNISGYQGPNAMEQGELGDCYFWIIKPNPDNEHARIYGLTAESGKLDINYLTYDQLMLLPNMTDQAASNIIDWRSLSPTDVSPNMDGEEDAYYMATYGYHIKNAPFETLDELRLVDGVAGQSPEILYDADLNHDGFIDPIEANNANTGDAFAVSQMGIIPCLTIYGVNASNPANATASAGTTATTGGTTAAGGVASTNALVDVNNAANLRTLLTQYGLTAGGAAPTGGYKSVFDWAVRSGLSSTDLSTVYLQLTCLPTGGTVGGGGGRGGRGGGGGAAVTPPAKTPLVDVNEASEATLVTMGFTDQDAQAIIAYRTTANADPSQKANISWLLDVCSDIPQAQWYMPTTDGSPYLSAMITGNCAVYSADIVTVSRDGRAFKRVKIVVDASSLVTDPDTGLITGGSPQIVYRRDLSDEGWPLDPQIREALRNGKSIDQLN